MTNGNEQQLGKASSPARRLLALLVGLLASLALIVSGAPSAAAQTRVGPQPVAMILTVGPTGTAGQENVGVRGPPGLRLVSATGVAAETADGAATVGKDAAQSCLNSFTGDTPVTLADGTQEPISEVKVGDKVLATDPETGQTKAEPVEQFICHTGKRAMVLVTMADGSVLDSTDRHPIWDATQGAFVDAGKLHAGDKIETVGGALITVSGLTGYSADLTAYNLQIGTIHTYYAGSTPVLVHNSCDPSDLRGLSNSYVKRLLKQFDTDPHAFKEEFVGRGSVSKFDIKMGPNGELHLANKDGSLVIPPA